MFGECENLTIQFSHQNKRKRKVWKKFGILLIPICDYVCHLATYPNFSDKSRRNRLFVLMLKSKSTHENNSPKE
ncbi:CLUMA_CG007549, isoform B [Clunio marinus]|uniref:CLUMA_CG007549, isoform B n=1 Tax=Clunio marinus TaxID=568069 RepID=A0A1J1I114_9DIPT|nr:CLUMA_CG007549, isoform B [Clunio marinus]